MPAIDKNKLNVLVVDDQPVNLKLVCTILASLPINIITAENGKEALELAKENKFALILLDVQMPEMDGFETANALRKNEKTVFTPIIFVTAISTDAENIRKGYESGAVDYLLKPVTPYILKSKVKIFLDLEEQTKVIKDQKKLLKEKNKELRIVLDEIRALKGLIPICSWCKNIRNDDGYWEKVEEYVERVSAAEFTHGVCPECSKKLKEEMEKKRQAYD